MKRAITVVALILNLLVGHALAAYDPEYGDETGNLPAFTVFGSVRPHKGTDLGADTGANIYASLNSRYSNLFGLGRGLW